MYQFSSTEIDSSMKSLSNLRRFHLGRGGRKGKRGIPSVLAQQETFPYDVLDEIFCFACENRLQRALELGSVCCFWYDRFRRNDRMWEQLSRAVVRIPRPRKRPSGGGPLIPTEWNTYLGVRRAVEVSKQFSPIPPENLRTMNGCGSVDIEDTFPEVFSPVSSRGQSIASVHLTFRCPLVLEALTMVEPGIAACHLCDRKVFKVQTQEELDERARKGDCVWMERKDLDPEASFATDVEIALFTDDFDQAVTALSTIAADPRVTERSTSMFPVFVVEAVEGRETCRLRITTFCIPSTHSHEAVTRSSPEIPTPDHAFQFLWFQPKPSTPPAERASWGERILSVRKTPRGILCMALLAKPADFLAQVLDYVSRVGSDIDMGVPVGDVIRPRPAPTCCQKMARSCRKCCSIQ